ncbi:hypothetical protein GX441_06615 [bacterium]|nr:hypothetical protein [bacterium]
MKRLALITLLAASMAYAGWMRTYGSSEKGELGRCAQQTTDGGYIVSGVIGGSPGWLIKTDSLGEIMWADTIGGGKWVEQTDDGCYILAGVPDLTKTDSSGDTLWSKDYGFYSRCVRPTQDGGFILTGATVDYLGKLVLIKTDSTGDSLWFRSYLLSGWTYSLGHFVESSSDGGYLAVGYLGDTTFENAKQAFWLLKTDSLGEIQWSYVQGGENWGDYEIGRCVRETSEGQFIALANFGLLKIDVSGDTLWTHEYRNGSHVQETVTLNYVLTGELLAQRCLNDNTQGSTWLIKTDSNGIAKWERSYGSGSLNCVSKTNDKGFILTGEKDGDLCLIKTDSLGLLGIIENPIVESDNGWNVPHSIGSYVVLHYQGLPQGFHANVFDVSGRKVDRIRGGGIEGAMTWGINYPPGVYFIQALDSRNQLKTAKVVLVR